MYPIITRTANLSDLPTLLEFEQGIVTTERPFDETIRDGEVHYYDLASMIGAADVEVVVAVAYQDIVGSGYARIETSKIYLKHPRHAYLGFMYVKPDYRGMGVNTKIISALKQWSLSHQVTELKLEVYCKN